MLSAGQPGKMPTYIRRQTCLSAAPLMYWAAASICVHTWNTCKALSGPITWVNVTSNSAGQTCSVPFSSRSASDRATIISNCVLWQSVLLHGHQLSRYSSLFEASRMTTFPFPVDLASHSAPANYLHTRDGRIASSAPMGKYEACKYCLTAPSFILCDSPHHVLGRSMANTISGRFP